MLLVSLMMLSVKFHGPTEKSGGVSGGVCTVPKKRLFLRTVIAVCLGMKIW